MSNPETIEASQAPSTPHAVVRSQDAVVRFLHVGIRTIFVAAVIGPMLPFAILIDVMVWPFFGYGFITFKDSSKDQLRAFAKSCGWHLYKSNPGHQGTTHLVRRTLDGVVGTPNQKGEA